MRFSYAEAMCDPSHYAPLAKAAEEVGWHSFVIPDSICNPQVSDSKYPYTPDGDRHFLEEPEGRDWGTYLSSSILAIPAF